MGTTDTSTARDLIEDALRKIGIVAIDEPMSADAGAAGLRALNRMLKAWQNRGWNLWAVASQSVVLTTAASYTLNPVRPVQIQSCRFKRSGIEMPLQRLTRDEYDNMPDKATTGTPTCFYYDRQREAAKLYIWPVLSAASGETLELTVIRELDDLTLQDTVDVPGEWYDAVVYGLASRLADDYSVADDTQAVTARAERELSLALAFDREESIWFHEPV